LDLFRHFGRKYFPLGDFMLFYHFCILWCTV
jgi:hypothetical protein